MIHTINVLNLQIIKKECPHKITNEICRRTSIRICRNEIYAMSFSRVLTISTYTKFYVNSVIYFHIINISYETIFLVHRFELNTDLERIHKKFLEWFLVHLSNCLLIPQLTQCKHRYSLNMLRYSINSMFRT